MNIRPGPLPRVQNRIAMASSMIITLVIAGIVMRRGELIALTMPLLVYGLAFIVTALTEQTTGIEATRSIATVTPTEGEEVEAVFTLANETGSPLIVAAIDLLPLPLAITDGTATTLTELAGGETTRVTYSFSTERGKHRFSGVQVTQWDKWGIGTWEKILPCDSTLTVLPRYETLGKIPIRPRRTKVYAGVVKALEGGEGTEFFGTREYTSGDDIKQINWKAYARYDRLVINEYEQERIADVTIILDARALTNQYPGVSDLFTRSVRAAAALADYFLDLGNNVGLLTYGAFLDWIYPSYGKRQRQRVLEALARVDISDKAVFQDLRFMPTRFFPSRSQLVIVSPLTEDDIEILDILHACEYQIIVVSPNPLLMERALHTDDPAWILAHRLAVAERKTLLSALMRVGIQVVDWDVARPLSPQIEWALSRQRSGR
ncbi:TPA: hypothetical protein DD712_03530 [Candidatus Acetothermia bacterium]|nr:hypothetical protein [Candidatus Acetothermia bacterium]